jgi:hypothetical protein
MGFHLHIRACYACMCVWSSRTLEEPRPTFFFSFVGRRRGEFMVLQGEFLRCMGGQEGKLQIPPAGVENVNVAGVGR